MTLSAFFDPEAGVWVGETDTLPICTEAATLDELVAKVRDMVEDLTEDRAPFELVARVQHEGLRSSLRDILARGGARAEYLRKIYGGR